MTKEQIMSAIKCDFNTIYNKTYYYICPNGYKISAIVSETDGCIKEGDYKEILAEAVLEYVESLSTRSF